MKKNRNIAIIEYLFIILLFINLFLGGLNRMFYLGSGVALIVLSLLMLVLVKYNKENRRIFIPILIWTILNLFYMLRDFTGISTYIGFQHIGILLYFWVITCLLSKEENKKIFVNFLKIIHIILLIVTCYLVLIKKQSNASIESYIYIGFGTFFAFIITNDKMKIKVFMLSVLWMILAYLVGARSLSIAFLLMYFVIFFITKVNVKEKVLNFIFIAYYVLLNLFPMLYTWLATSKYRYTLDMLAIKYTESRFFSGRDILWNLVYGQLTDFSKIVFGTGFDNIGQLVRGNMSFHNLYVTLIAEGGLLLIISFGLILFSIWKKLSAKNDFKARVIMGFIIAVLYKQSFDISLVENNLNIAFMVWTSIAVGLISNEKEVKEE